MPSQTSSSGRPIDFPAIIVTLSIAVVAGFLAWPQIFPGPAQADEMNLPNLDKRATMLRQIKDPVERDRYCIGLSALGRQLDRMLQPDARVYITGMLGPTNAASLGNYYFLRNYLFPRDVEISLGNVVYHDSDVEGTASSSPEDLKSNGFDVVIGFPNNQIQVLPLTPRGVPKQ